MPTMTNDRSFRATLRTGETVTGAVIQAPIPDWWHRANDLLAPLADASAHTVAYAERASHNRRAALEAAGLRECGVLPRWIGAEMADVVVFSNR